MSAITQSGYPVLPAYGDPALVANPAVPGAPGVRVLGGLRAGAVATVLLYFASRFHAEVEQLRQTYGVWGYAPREIRDGAGWSNHAGGAAVDLNAALHPQHRRGTFTDAQYRGMHRIANELAAAAGRPILRLGIDWAGSSVDEMHVEIAPDLAGTGYVEHAAHLITTGRLPAVPAQLREEDDNMKATDTITLRDAYAASTGKGADRTLAVEDAIKTGFNYGSVAARDAKTLKGQVTKLTNMVKTLQAQVAELASRKS